MKQKTSGKILKKQNPYKVSKRFMEWLENFNNEHKDALKELAKH